MLNDIIRKFFICWGRLSVLTLLVAGLVVAGQTPSHAEKLAQKKIRVAFNQQIPLQEALKEVYKQTGYTVYVRKNLSKVPVQGIYWDTTIDAFLRRVLKNYNVSVLYNDLEKVAVVRDFGESLRGAGEGGTFVSFSEEELADEELEAPKGVDPLSGMPLAELRRIKREQMAELERIRNDPDSFDPFSGLSRAAMEENQEKLNQQRSDPEAIDPLSGLPLSELRERQTETDRQRNDPDAIDPLSGIPYSELKKKQEEYQKQRKENPGVDPLSQIPPSSFED